MSQFAREKLAQYVLDPNNSPLRVLGAAVSFVNLVGNPVERRIVGAVDETIMRETKAHAAGDHA